MGLDEAEVVRERHGIEFGELKTRIREVWDELDAKTIRKWLRELRPRLQKVIDDDGKPIQQYFNKV